VGHLTLEEQQRLLRIKARLAERRREDELRDRESRGPLSFREYVGEATRGGFIWHTHAERMAAALQMVADRRIRNLVLIAPPRHGKTETAARLFSGYWGYRYPDQWVGLTAYGSTLAHGYSRKAREYYLQAGGELGQKSTDGEWHTGGGGGIWADGVRGSLTGRGFHLGVVDDPIKDDREAQSPTYREGLWDWWQSVFTTRQEPEAAKVVVLTRWHHDDLIGRIMANETATAAHSPGGDQWHVLHLQAIRSESDFPTYPETVQVLSDWRRDGQALCPERYSLDQLRRRKASTPRVFRSMYQGDPVPRSGSFFQVEWFDIVDRAPSTAVRVRGWDRAASKDEGDFTAGVKMSRTPAGVYYIEDVKRGQWSSGRRDSIIRQTAELDGKATEQASEQEPGASGKTDAIAFRQLLEGFTTNTTPATGSKLIRAGPMASAAEIGNVKLVRGPWNRDYLEELAAFPFGHFDDQVDGGSIAFARLQSKRPTPTSEDYTSIKA
jgi:predicted phage terminase large subunit-like protein